MQVANRRDTTFIATQIFLRANGHAKMDSEKLTQSKQRKGAWSMGRWLSFKISILYIARHKKAENSRAQSHCTRRKICHV